MSELVHTETQQIDGAISRTQSLFSDGSKIEIFQKGDKLLSTKEISSDGSYRLYNAEDVKIEEMTSDGTFRKFDPQTSFLKEEKSSDGTIKTFHENGNLSTIKTLDGKYFCYYENGNLSEKEENGNILKLYADGHTAYELKDGYLTIDSDFYSFYRLGVKTKDTATHWQEGISLDPTKKTLICLGGDQTKDAQTANGNINVFFNVLGLSYEQKENIQLCSCYRPNCPRRLCRLLNQTGNTTQQVENDYRREILQRFMPFIAQVKDGKLERYSGEKLAENFRNIIIQAHCYGANDLPRFSQVFNETMSKVGYTDKEQKNAMRQIICITNNSQREFKDNLGFTTIHRYSVTDGQFEPEYKEEFSAGYPLFLEKHSEFSKKNGSKASFVSLRPNEMLMIFDKVLTKGSEHNSGFWDTESEDLTTVGKKQADLMQRIGQFWYSNTAEITSVSELIKKASEGSSSAEFVKKSVAAGQKLSREQQSVLKNKHILKSAWNKFNSPDVAPEKTGIYKFLSAKYR